MGPFRGPKWDPAGGQNGTHSGPKMGPIPVPKRAPFWAQNGSRFGSTSGPAFDRNGRNGRFGPKWPKRPFRAEMAEMAVSCRNGRNGRFGPKRPEPRIYGPYAHSPYGRMPVWSYAGPVIGGRRVIFGSM